MNYTVKIALEEKGDVFFCSHVMELIKYIDLEKSVKEAAKSMNITTAKAWKMIRGIEKALGEKAVVKTRTAGVDGYNVHISPACRSILEKYADFKEKSEAAIKDLFNQIF